VQLTVYNKELSMKLSMRFFILVALSMSLSVSAGASEMQSDPIKESIEVARERATLAERHAQEAKDAARRLQKEVSQLTSRLEESLRHFENQTHLPQTQIPIAANDLAPHHQVDALHNNVDRLSAGAKETKERIDALDREVKALAATNNARNLPEPQSPSLSSTPPLAISTQQQELLARLPVQELLCALAWYKAVTMQNTLWSTTALACIYHYTLRSTLDRLPYLNPAQKTWIAQSLFEGMLTAILNSALNGTTPSIQTTLRIPAFTNSSHSGFRIIGTYLAVDASCVLSSYLVKKIVPDSTFKKLTQKINTLTNYAPQTTACLGWSLKALATLLVA
jgi:hypothetical protein